MTTKLYQHNVELSSYFGSLSRMCLEAELSEDPRVHVLAIGVIARQSDIIRKALDSQGRPHDRSGPRSHSAPV